MTLGHDETFHAWNDIAVIRVFLNVVDTHQNGELKEFSRSISRGIVSQEGRDNMHISQPITRVRLILSRLTYETNI